jgi:NAD(P)-dependent dehydrogenase (short-subunit alcohol dehydrogenase family)
VRVILITGGSRGFGAETARRAADRGYNVAILYRGNTVATESVAANVAARGRRCMTFQGSNAGIPRRIGRVEDLDMAMLREVLEANVVGAFTCAREAVRRMSTRYGGKSGVIVYLYSLGAETGSPGELVHYAAAKGAIESFTRGLAREAATEGIRVNAVSPGLIASDIHAEAGDGAVGLDALILPASHQGEAH